MRDCREMNSPFLSYLNITFIVLKNDYNPLTVKASIKEYCKKNLASYAIPKEFEFRKSLPKTLIGKVDFKKLREEAVKDEEE